MATGDPQPCKDDTKGIGARAFSLFELLVVTVVLALLLALIVPAMASSRKAGRLSVCTRQLNDHARAMVVYANDQRDLWPFPFVNGLESPYTGTGANPRSPYLKFGYCWAASYWHAPLAAYLDIDPHSLSFDCPDSTFMSDQIRDAENRTRAWSGARELSMAMFLDPMALDPRSPSWEQRFFKTQRHADVVFPSQKAALFDNVPLHDARSKWQGRTLLTPPPWRRPAAACDGSVLLRDGAACVPGLVFTAQLPRPGIEESVSQTDSLRFTPGGIRGRDWPFP